MRPLNTNPPTFLLAALVLAVALNFAVPILNLVPAPWRLLGALPLILGVVVNFQADQAFHTAETAVDPSKDPSALVTFGPYRLTRNPMYFGFVLILLGVALLLGSLSPYLAVLAFGLLMNTTFIPIEEQKLAAAFGSQWAAYQRRVRRWL